MANRLILNTLVKIYGFLFVFTSICRQFRFAKVLDLRYPAFIIGVIIIVRYLIMNQKSELRIAKRRLFIYGYFTVAILSNICWLFNGIKISTEGFYKLITLHAFNIVGIIVFTIYVEYYMSSKIWKWIIFSCVILMISMLLAYWGINMEIIWGSGLKGANIVDGATNLTRNLIGENIRASGYAEDPNYATLFMVIGIIAAFYSYKGGVKYIYIFSFLLGIALANSNTVVISILISMLISVFIRKINKSEDFMYSFMFFGICLTIVLLPILGIREDLLTLRSRYAMWQNAMKLFMKNPLLGNGWTSFRSTHLWYVHCHSTYWEILCENGILAFICYIGYCKRTLLSVNSYGIKFLLICYCIYSMMFDMSYMQIGVLVLYLIPEVYIYEERTDIIPC